MAAHYAELIRAINEHIDDGIDLGDDNCDLNPSLERISETEKSLGCKLPPSYIWFVQNYGGGEIYGEEIFSIYPVYSDQSVGDIAYQTEWARHKGFVSRTSIVICRNDFGEYFCMDSSSPDDDGEYPVFVQAGLERTEFAQSFSEFLQKKICDPEG